MRIQQPQTLAALTTLLLMACVPASDGDGGDSSQSNGQQGSSNGQRQGRRVSGA